MPLADKKHKKGLKKTQANNAKAMSASAEAIKALIKPKEVKPKIQKGVSHKLDRLVYIAHPKLGKYAGVCIAKVSGCAGQRPRPRIKPRPRQQLQLQFQLRLSKVSSPLQRLRVDISVCQHEGQKDWMAFPEPLDKLLCKSSPGI
ncbi:60S ribosomal protein L29 [Plecturocebus cupreus]